MINLCCSVCGDALTLGSTSEWGGEVSAEVHCNNCSAILEETSDELDEVKVELHDYKSEIEGLYHDLEELQDHLTAREREIKDLKDFIDGYIDDR